jgi:hypothetical protein
MDTGEYGMTINSKLVALGTSVLGMSCFGLNAHAQNAGGVFPPTVNEGHKSAQYRITYNPDTEAMVQRVHYQQAANDDLMWRGVIQTRKTNDSDVDLDFVQGELFWDLGENGDFYRTGFRGDARIRSEGRPGLLGAHWMNLWQFNSDWQARFNVMTFKDIGNDARDGVFFLTRGQLMYSGAPGATLGVEFYNSYGALDDINDFEDQTHQIGPTASFKVNKDWGIYTNALFGLTDASADTELRLWVTRGF